MATVGERVPPQNLEAEQSVLGSMLIDKEAIYTASELLTGEDFYRSAHQKIFEAIISLCARGEPVDLITLSDELRGRKGLQEAGGMQYLVLLADVVPTAANVQYYAEIVREKAILRALISGCTQIISAGFGSPQDVDELLDRAEQKIFEVGRRALQGFSPKRGPGADLERIENYMTIKRGNRSLFRLYRSRYHISAGLQEADLIIVAPGPVW